MPDGTDEPRRTERLLALPELGSLTARSTVACYVARGHEPQTALLLSRLRDRGVRVLLPVVLADLDLDWALDEGEHAAGLGPGVPEPTGPRLGVEAIGEADVVVTPALAVDRQVLEVLVTAFRDLRAGRTKEGWAVEKPSTVMSTAEAVGVATSMGLQSGFLDASGGPMRLLPGYLLGVVMKDDPKDRGRLLAWWDGAVKRRAEQDPLWKELHELRHVVEG